MCQGIKKVNEHFCCKKTSINIILIFLQNDLPNTNCIVIFVTDIWASTLLLHLIMCYIQANLHQGYSISTNLKTLEFVHLISQIFLKFHIQRELLMLVSGN